MKPATLRFSFSLMSLFVLGSAMHADAGGYWKRRGVVTTSTTSINPANANAPSAMLGTFYPTPVVYVRGDNPTGKGYTPLGMYSSANLSVYGPTSMFRSVSAPVRIYSRGYDGSVTETEGTTTSNPFLPEPQPVNYPSANSNYYKPRRLTSPPWWQSGINWVDQN